MRTASVIRRTRHGNRRVQQHRQGTSDTHVRRVMRQNRNPLNRAADGPAAIGKMLHLNSQRAAHRDRPPPVETCAVGGNPSRGLSFLRSVDDGVLRSVAHRRFESLRDVADRVRVGPSKDFRRAPLPPENFTVWLQQSPYVGGGR